MNLVQLTPLLSLALTCISAADLCSQVSPHFIEQVIVHDNDGFDFEACMQNAITGCNLPLIPFLFESGFYQYDWEKVFALASSVNILTDESITAMKLVAEYKLTDVLELTPDIDTNFIFAAIIGDINSLRAYLKNEEASEYLQRHARFLTERLLALYRTEGALPPPKILYYFSNEPYYEDIMKSAELIKAISDRAKKEVAQAKIAVFTTGSAMMTYDHIIEHVLQKKWFKELGLAYAETKELYQRIYF